MTELVLPILLGAALAVVVVPLVLLLSGPEPTGEDGEREAE